MISIQGLSHTYAGQKKIQFQDFTIRRGEQWLLLGDSGSGKTTLLHLIGGLLKAQQGRIDVEGTDITKLSDHLLDRFRGQHFGFVFQKNHLIPSLSVKNNLLLSPFLAGLNQDVKRVEASLSQLMLLEKKNANVKQAQRVAIARAILNKPAVILADEPTSALDDGNCERVIQLLSDASAQNGATLIVATHDQRLKSQIKNIIQL